jgi:hypothetical protein
VETLAGPDVPPAGALPGSLVLAEADGCRLRLIAFAIPSIGDPGMETLCRVWASPAGGYAAVATRRGGRADIREIEIVRLGDPAEPVEKLGFARGEVVWSADGKLLAWCSPGGASIVHDLESGADREFAGCDPRFAPDGALLTRSEDALSSELLRDGRTVLQASDFERGFESNVDGPIQVLEFDVSSDGTIAVTVSKLTQSGDEAVLELWRDGELQGSFGLPEASGQGGTRLGGFLRFGPAGNELAVGYTPGTGELTLVDLDLGRVLFRSVTQRGLAWSPDGAWLALAVDDEIRVFGAVRDEPSYVLPVAAASIGWIPGEEPTAGG